MSARSVLRSSVRISADHLWIIQWALYQIPNKLSESQRYSLRSIELFTGPYDREADVPSLIPADLIRYECPFDEERPFIDVNRRTSLIRVDVFNQKRVKFDYMPRGIVGDSRTVRLSELINSERLDYTWRGIGDIGYDADPPSVFITGPSEYGCIVHIETGAVPTVRTVGSIASVCIIDMINEEPPPRPLGVIRDVQPVGVVHGREAGRAVRGDLGRRLGEVHPWRRRIIDWEVCELNPTSREDEEGGHRDGDPAVHPVIVDEWCTLILWRLVTY